MRAKKNNIMKVVEWSDEDKCYVGSALPLIGPCCHGDNEAEVYKALCQIVEEWLREGDSNPRGNTGKIAEKKFSGKFMLRIDPKLHKALAIKASRAGRSLNAYIAERLGRA